MSIQPFTTTQDDKWNGAFQTTMKSHSKSVWISGPVIIGAGPSGLAVAACLKTRLVPFFILEKEDCIGSLWKLKTYDRLQLHLPKKFCELPYMPFPPEFPTYPTKQLFMSYLEAYAKHFCIEPMFNQDVKSASYDATMGFWRVQANDYELFCRWLVVATGENAEPMLPDIPGISDFKGRMTHTSKYKGGCDFKGRKVLVVGGGNSGMEVSLDLYNSGAQVSLAIRDKLHILPRELIGKSTFAVSMRLLKWLPVKVVDKILLICSRVIFGDTQSVGIKRPEIGPLELKNSTGKTPVLDVGAFAKIKSGEIKVVSGIRKFTASGAEFVDGKVEEFDSVILATGYRSNVKSWLKGDNFFDPYPNNWKSMNGLYSVGFSGRALLGASIDAKKVAEDIVRQWETETRHLRIEP